MNKKTFPLQDLNRHRAWLFGFAALWILFLHMCFQLPNHPALAPLHWLKNSGSCGVDMFAILSAAGLYHSFRRDERILPFYRRRLLRVFLPTAIVVTIHYGFRGVDSLQYLRNFIVTPFWYVPYILTMYLIYPIIYHLQKKSRWLPVVLLAGALLFPMAAKLVVSRWAGLHERALTRVPAFIIGCILAPHIERGAHIRRGWILAPAAGYILCAMAGVWPLNRYAGLMLAMFALMGLSMLGNCFVRGDVRRWFYRLMAFFGGISLELYLIQERLSSWLMKLDIYASGRCSLYKLEIFNTLATILLAVLLQGLCKLLTKRFESVSLPEPPAEEKA